MATKVDADLVRLQQIVELGDAQIRRTMDLYLELLEKFTVLSASQKTETEDGNRETGSIESADNSH